jgi:TM2 domain-containing membrane protein YozV
MKNNYVIQTSNKSKKVALWVWLFLGVFGGHYYYVGRFGRGLLFTCTMGLLVFGWIADLFTILGGNFKDGAGVPLRQ